MMFNFDDMAKNLQSNINLGATTYQDDTRFWKISKDENGKGAAIIRLVPDKNLVPFIKMFHYSLKKPNPMTQGKYFWYIARSPDTIGQPDPVKEHYMRLIAENTEESKAEAKKYSRQTQFIANILVVKDPANSDNNGKIFLWAFGTKLLNKFNSWLKPSEQELAMGSEPMNIFHPTEGYNITLKIRPDQHSFTYDDTTIVAKSSSIHESVTDDASAMKYIKGNTYELNEFLKPEAFDSYETLKAKFEKFMGSSIPTQTTQAKKPAPVEEDNGWMDEKPAKKEERPKAAKVEEEDNSWMDDL